MYLSIICVIFAKVNRYKVLDDIARNKMYKACCKAVAPKNWEEVYSTFLLIICEKPNEYFAKDLEFRLKALIKMLSRPGSVVNYRHKTKPCLVSVENSWKYQSITHSSDFAEPMLFEEKDLERTWDYHDNKQNTETQTEADLHAEALHNVYESETYWYYKTFLGLLMQGKGQKGIRQLTKNQLPDHEVRRVFQILKQKIKLEYIKLCKSQ
jgi:hypothetical protein